MPIYFDISTPLDTEKWKRRKDIWVSECLNNYYLKSKHSMSCNCASCQRDNILNGTSTGNCFLCSTILDKQTSFQIMPDKTLVCEKCISEKYQVCNCCRKLNKIDELKIANHINLETLVITKVKVCKSCFTNSYNECKGCHDVFERNNMIGRDDGRYCKACFTKSYQVCSHCHSVHPREKITHYIRGQYLVCDECFQFYGPVELYEKKPTLMFHGIPPHYYGVELEVELKNAKKIERGAKAYEVLNLFPKDFLVLKEDGSIKCGFEMCSQPATIEEHKRMWTPFFDKLPDNIHSFNTSNCGLHVHCSKKPLSLLTIAKIVVFINDEKNQSFVEMIAGRRSCTYSCIQKKEYNTVKRIGYLGRGDRYEAVNLVNKDTIEFRIFKGTLKRESFYKALEFCDAVIRFCMTAANGIVYCRNKENFIEFVKKWQNDYPHLYAFICAKVLKQETKLTKLYGYHIEGQSIPTPQPTTVTPQPIIDITYSDITVTIPQQTVTTGE
jgi:hypothetical protein